VKSPGQNGSRERGFGTLKYEQLFLEEIAGRFQDRASCGRMLGWPTQEGASDLVHEIDVRE
jgi:hypothetical protein